MRDVCTSVACICKEKAIELFYWVYNKIMYKTILKKSVYSDMTPLDSLSNEHESIKALRWALFNPKIKNIALTGPYGAGKSSVIESYLKSHKRCKAINISLATFDGRTWDKIQQLVNEERFDEAQALKKEFEDELEKGILKQLFYKVNADKIPLSRYRKLHHSNLWKYAMGILLLVLVLLSALYLVFPSEVIAFLKDYLKGINTLREISLIVIALGFVFWGSSYAVRFVLSKFTVKEISVGDISAQGGEISTDSILNKNIDEMLYFFERTKYRVVFIEDLDRFNNTSIFIKLREINSILNNYEVIRKRGKITFVYAVKDDLFQEKTDRTKFFDFLIPIIPVINSTNSGEVMRNLLGIGEKREKDKEYPEHDISQEFVTLVSPYIGDMRVLISTINEFWVYKRTLKDTQDVQLKDECMLALMIYKNLYPQDFALLEAETGNIKLAFKYKDKVLKEAQESLENERCELELFQQDIAISIVDVKILILSEMIEHKGVVSRIVIEGSSYNYAQLLADTFSFDKLRKGQIRVYYRQYNSSSETDYGSLSDIEESSQRFEKLFEKYDRQLRMSAKSIESFKIEFEKIDKEISMLRASTIQQLIERKELESVLPKDVRENSLLVFMLRRGYINESYADYINYFHPGSISKAELNFILSIRNFNGENDYSYAIKHCANLIDRLYDYEFEQVEVLNFDLLDFFIKSNGETEKFEKLLGQLIAFSESSQKFIKAYIERGINVNRFWQLLCQRSSSMWTRFMFDNQLSQEKKDNYLKMIINACAIEDIKANNSAYTDEVNGIYAQNAIKEYFESDKDILLKMSDLSWDKVKQVLEVLNIRFANVNLTGLESWVVKDILQGRYFELNRDMLEAICDVFTPGSRQELFAANYQWLCKLNNGHLLEYVHENFSKYIKDFVLGEESNVEEGIDSVNHILRRLFEEDEELCTKVIEKEHYARWARLEDCLAEFEDDGKQTIWDCLLANDRTDATWSNYLTYRNLFGLSDVLLSFFDRNVDAIVEDVAKEDVTDEIINELLIADLSDVTFEKFISKYKVVKFTHECKVFSLNRLEMMVRKHYFEFTPEIFGEIKTISNELGLDFACENLSTFLENVEQLEMEADDVKYIIRRGVLEDKDVLKLLLLIEPEQIDNELALMARDLGIALPKAYVEAMWQVLEEKDKYQVLLDQLKVYSLDEIALKFGELGGVYNQFAKRTTHKYVLHHTTFNEELCRKLEHIGFLSSCKIINEKVGVDHITFESRYEKRITGYVRKKTT